MTTTEEKLEDIASALWRIVDLIEELRDAERETTEVRAPGEETQNDIESGDA